MPAHRPDALRFGSTWPIRGIDGRPVSPPPPPGRGASASTSSTPATPPSEAYLFEWIEHYVKHLGIDGIFWDSAFQPLPPDFGDKPYMDNPGQAGPHMLSFYERVYRFGKSLSPDFFMWGEGITTDAPMNAYAVDNRQTPEAHRLMHRLAHRGPRRLVWRSAWPHDLASGFPFLSPTNDIGLPPTEEAYQKIADDPMNEWVCRTVREQGVRDAIGLAPGVSLLGDFVVVSPGVSGTVHLSESRVGEGALEHVFDGSVTRGEASPEGVAFDLPEAGAYRVR